MPHFVRFPSGPYTAQRDYTSMPLIFCAAVTLRMLRTASLVYYRTILCQRRLGRVFFCNKTSPGRTKRSGGLRQKNEKMPRGENAPGGSSKKQFFSTHPPDSCVDRFPAAAYLALNTQRCRVSTASTSKHILVGSKGLTTLGDACTLLSIPVAVGRNGIRQIYSWSLPGVTSFFVVSPGGGRF